MSFPPNPKLAPDGLPSHRGTTSGPKSWRACTLISPSYEHEDSTEGRVGCHCIAPNGPPRLYSVRYSPVVDLQATVRESSPLVSMTRGSWGHQAMVSTEPACMYGESWILMSGKPFFLKSQISTTGPLYETAIWTDSVGCQARPVVAILNCPGLFMFTMALLYRRSQMFVTPCSEDDARMKGTAWFHATAVIPIAWALEALCGFETVGLLGFCKSQMRTSPSVLPDAKRLGLVGW
mmetsp:Transcript_1982/g.3628  ORF Transcript_1982/g.3628 Transcript_1982/m.3628 type:complete len:235 (+) Transcript_1982:1391-2095(+)